MRHIFLALCLQEGAENHRCQTQTQGKKEIVFLPAAELIFQAHHDGRSGLLDAIYSLVIHQRSHLPSQQNQHLPQYTLTAAGVQYRGWMQNLSRYLSSFPEPAPADVSLSLINHFQCFLSDFNLALKLENHL